MTPLRIEDSDATAEVNQKINALLALAGIPENNYQAFYSNQRPVSVRELMEQNLANRHRPEEMAKVIAEHLEAFRGDYESTAAEINVRQSENQATSEFMAENPAVFAALNGFNLKTPEQRRQALEAIADCLEARDDFPRIPIEHLAEDDRAVVRCYADYEGVQRRNQWEKPRSIEPRLTALSIRGALKKDEDLKPAYISGEARQFAQARADQMLLSLRPEMDGISAKDVEVQWAVLEKILDILDTVDGPHVAVPCNYLNLSDMLGREIIDWLTPFCDTRGEPQLNVHHIRTSAVAAAIEKQQKKNEA